MMTAMQSGRCRCEVEVCVITADWRGNVTNRGSSPAGGGMICVRIDDRSLRQWQVMLHRFLFESEMSA